MDTGRRRATPRPNTPPLSVNQLSHKEKRWDKYNPLMFAQILKTNRKKKIAKKV